eukprot:TRINITY_DN9849_c0_g1_i1.p1 TRINITY_DN9849_c0_g1~~TRINITY_DN9849_c0_g1_i1.p1  ORF type:complete len:203 (+),score=20.70 TRINITY_DN9849_c0_g1_i1:245-853(+)
MSRKFLQRYALFVIDMTGQHKEQAQSIVGNVNRTIRTLRNRHTPILFTQWQYSVLPENIQQSYVFRLQMFQHMDFGLQSWQLLPELNLSANDRIFDQKSGLDAFTDDRVEDYLEDHDVQGVIISGVSTQSCCLATARTAFEKGYDVVMLSDGMAASNLEDHENALIQASEFARVMTCDEAREGYYLIGDEEIAVLRQKSEVA